MEMGGARVTTIQDQNFFSFGWKRHCEAFLIHIQAKNFIRSNLPCTEEGRLLRMRLLLYLRRTMPRNDNAEHSDFIRRISILFCGEIPISFAWYLVSPKRLNRMTS